MTTDRTDVPSGSLEGPSGPIVPVSKQAGLWTELDGTTHFATLYRYDARGLGYPGYGVETAPLGPGLKPTKVFLGPDRPERFQAADSRIGGTL